MNLKEYNQTYNDMKQVIGSARKYQRVARAVYMSPKFYKEFNRAYQTFVCKEWTRKITDVEGVPIIIKEFGKNYVIDES
ncbi:hypothetical protein PML95_09965 (plasmid) [Vagococcus lutrae]|uniref:Uncharacterized protein n=1 Tax=Vagococcus lutrae TaxID=81947 RepID=A0AAF0BH29_9ENTE|nr:MULTISPECIES: hypothetical protein [Vagococcus]MCO7151730.1 hypothetical protein [Vagococcus lutrae]MDT2801921.1 hypothetical protein [Vagococcus lutrae]UQF11344.1 hypothetical protein M2919_07565 [Vagococcus lutrae]WCG06067.1 hypothetical protein PML89_09545 [Vagococcus lutrae]WCG23689.1 hypothetical protein PML95_09965 [Vagococcus lutrae]